MRRIAGQSRPEPAVLHVDYADVLAQAVDNERWRILREVERVANRIGVTKPSETRSYASDDVPAKDYKAALLRALQDIAEGQR